MGHEDCGTSKVKEEYKTSRVIVHDENFAGAHEIESGDKRAMQFRARVHVSIENTSNTDSVFVGFEEKKNKMGKWLTPEGRAQIHSNVGDLRDDLSDQTKILSKDEANDIRNTIKVFDNLLDQDLETRKGCSKTDEGWRELRKEEDDEDIRCASCDTHIKAGDTFFFDGEYPFCLDCKKKPESK